MRTIMKWAAVVALIALAAMSMPTISAPLPAGQLAGAAANQERPELQATAEQIIQSATGAALAVLQAEEGVTERCEVAADLETTTRVERFIARALRVPEAPAPRVAASVVADTCGYDSDIYID